MQVMGAHLVSVNAGRAVPARWAGSPHRTAIHKTPVTGPVRVHRLGLDGDEVGDARHHGGVHQAVYAFAQEDLDHWAEQLGEPVAPGMFGENLTTAGIDVNAAMLGEQWRIGTALLSPVEVRIPCNTFKAWLGREGFDDTAWVKRFTAAGRPGPYLRVVEEGVLTAGDEIVVEERPAHGVTVATMFAALTTDPTRLPDLLEVEGLPERVYAKARAHAERSDR